MKTRITGLGIDLAIFLTAEGKLPDKEIAARLNVDVSTLQEVQSKPSFLKRVEKERKVIEMQKQLRDLNERLGNPLKLPPASRSKSGSPESR